MNKFFSFLTGALCGALVGATIALLMAPSSGQQLRADVTGRWEEALAEARHAMDETRRELRAQLEQMQQGNIQPPAA